jgi:hypothetical protein
MSTIISCLRSACRVELAARFRRGSRCEKNNKIRDVCATPAGLRCSWSPAIDVMHIDQIAVSAGLLDEFNSKP